MNVRDAKTALYRHFDANDRLLYVGISLSPLDRLRQHRAASHWAKKITRVAVEWFECRPSAMAAELKAITTEMPLNNIDGNGAVIQHAGRQFVGPPKPRHKPKRLRPTFEQMQAAIASIGRRV